MRMIGSNVRRAAAATALVVLFCGMTAGSALAVTLSFSPADATFHGEQLQTVDIVADEVEDLLGASLVIGFDPAVLTPVAVTPGGLVDGGQCELFFTWTNEGLVVDSVALDTALLGCSASGGGVVATVTFAGAGVGSSALTLTRAELRDHLNASLPVTVDAGQLTHLAPGLSVLPEQLLFQDDQVAEVCLEVSGVSDFQGLSAVLEFDPAVITPAGVSAGTALTAFGCENFLDWGAPGDGTLTVDLALLGCHGPLDGPVACLTFTGVESGESPLTWLTWTVRDHLNAGVPVTATGGVILYDSAVATEAVSWDRVKARYR